MDLWEFFKACEPTIVFFSKMFLWQTPWKEKNFLLQRKGKDSLTFGVIKVRSLFGAKAGFAYTITKDVFSQSLGFPSFEANVLPEHDPGLSWYLWDAGSKKNQCRDDLCGSVEA